MRSKKKLRVYTASEAKGLTYIMMQRINYSFLYVHTNLEFSDVSFAFLKWELSNVFGSCYFEGELWVTRPQNVFVFVVLFLFFF